MSLWRIPGCISSHLGYRCGVLPGCAGSHLGYHYGVLPRCTGVAPGLFELTVLLFCEGTKTQFESLYALACVENGGAGFQTHTQGLGTIFCCSLLYM